MQEGYYWYFDDSPESPQIVKAQMRVAGTDEWELVFTGDEYPMQIRRRAGGEPRESLTLVGPLVAPPDPRTASRARANIAAALEHWHLADE